MSSTDDLTLTMKYFFVICPQSCFQARIKGGCSGAMGGPGLFSKRGPPKAIRGRFDKMLTFLESFAFLSIHPLPPPPPPQEKKFCFIRFSTPLLAQQKILGLLNESHPRVFQTITLSFLIAFKARQGYGQLGKVKLSQVRLGSVRLGQINLKF